MSRIRGLAKSKLVGMSCVMALLSGCGSSQPIPGTDAATAPAQDAQPSPDDLGEGPGGITPGQALGKFCHELNRSGGPVELTLELGDPALVRITARTGVCAPPAGMPCLSIPVGRVPLRLLEGDKLLTSRAVILSDGNEYVFQPVITSNLQVAVTGGRIATGTCQGLDFPPPDGGSRDTAIPADAGGADSPLPQD
jgi:hypothetical protein